MPAPAAALLWVNGVGGVCGASITPPLPRGRTRGTPMRARVGRCGPAATRVRVTGPGHYRRRGARGSGGDGAEGGEGGFPCFSQRSLFSFFTRAHRHDGRCSCASTGGASATERQRQLCCLSGAGGGRPWALLTWLLPLPPFRRTVPRGFPPGPPSRSLLVGRSYLHQRLGCSGYPGGICAAVKACCGKGYRKEFAARVATRGTPRCGGVVTAA